MHHKRENPRPFWQRALLGFIEALQFFGIAGGAAASKPAARITPLSQRIRMRETASASSGVRRTSPFVRVRERAIPPAPEPGIAQEKESGSVRYTVKRGDSLWKIAEREYGQGERWTDIWKANHTDIHEPNLIYPGQNISVPVEETSRGILIHRAMSRESAAKVAVSPAFASLRTRVARQSATLAASLNNVSAALDQVSFGEGSGTATAAQEKLHTLVAKARTLSAATSSAPSNIALIDSVVGLLDAAHDAVESVGNFNTKTVPISVSGTTLAVHIVAPATGVVATSSFELSHTAGESVHTGSVQYSLQLEKKITATAITIIAASRAASGAAQTPQSFTSATNAKEFASTSLQLVKGYLAAGDTQAAVTSSVEAVLAAVAANVVAPASPEAVEATATAVNAVQVVRGADPVALASAVQYLENSGGDGGTGFQGAPPGMSLTESNPQLAAEIANAINSPLGIIGRVLSPVLLSIPLTIVAGEIRQSLTAQGLNPATGLPSPAADAGLGTTGENVDPTGKSVTGTVQGEAGNVGAAMGGTTALAPASGTALSPSSSVGNAMVASALGISDSAAFALNAGIQIASHINAPSEIALSGIIVTPSTDPNNNSLTVTNTNGQSANVTVSPDNTVTAVSSDNITFAIAPDGTVTTFNAAGAVTSFTTIGKIASQNVPQVPQAQTIAKDDLISSIRSLTSEELATINLANFISFDDSAALSGAKISQSKNSDGTRTITVRGPRGEEGATVTLNTDGSVVAVTMDGTVDLTISPQGIFASTVTTKDGKGAINTVNTDGVITVISSDGKITTFSLKGTSTSGVGSTSVPGGTTGANADSAAGAAMGGTVAPVSAVSSPNLDQMGFLATPQSMAENAGRIAADALAVAGLFGAGSVPAMLSTVTGSGVTSQIANAAIAAAAKGDITTAAGLAVATAVTAMAISRANPGSPQSQAATGDMQAAFAALQGFDQAKTNLAISDQITGVIFAANKNIPGLIAKGDISGLGEIAVVANFAANMTGEIADSTMDSQAIGNHNFVATVNDAVQSSLQALEATNTPQAVAAGQIAGLDVVSDDAAEGKITEVTSPQPVNIFGQKGIDLASLTQSVTGTVQGGAGIGATSGSTSGITGSVDLSTGAPAGGIGDATGTTGIGDTSASGGTPAPTSSPAPSTFSASGATTPAGLAVLSTLGNIKGNESGIPSDKGLNLTIESLHPTIDLSQAIPFAAVDIAPSLRSATEAAAQNASNPALAGGTAIGNSMSVTTATGITGTVGIMSFGAAQQSAMTVTLSNGVTASFGMNAGTLSSQGLTNSEGQQAIALALQSTQQAMHQGAKLNPQIDENINPQLKGQIDEDTTPQTPEDVEDAGLGQAMSNAAAAAAGPTSADVDAAAAVDAANAAAGAVTGEPDAAPDGGEGEGEGEGGGGAGGGEMCEEEHTVSIEYESDSVILKKFGIHLDRRDS